MATIRGPLETVGDLLAALTQLSLDTRLGLSTPHSLLGRVAELDEIDGVIYLVSEHDAGL